jgi:hypothetical protein
MMMLQFIQSRFVTCQTPIKIHGLWHLGHLHAGAKIALEGRVA